MEIKKIKSEPRIKFRGEEPKVEKVKTLTEKADFNFPKTLLGVVLIGAGIGCNYVGFLAFASDMLLNAGIGLTVAGIGLKINRVAKGGRAWQNEINLLKSIIKKGK
jgi:hypothetical protein